MSQFTHRSFAELLIGFFEEGVKFHLEQPFLKTRLSDKPSYDQEVVHMYHFAIHVLLQDHYPDHADKVLKYFDVLLIDRLNQMTKKNSDFAKVKIQRVRKIMDYFEIWNEASNQVERVGAKIEIHSPIKKICLHASENIFQDNSNEETCLLIEKYYSNFVQSLYQCIQTVVVITDDEENG